MIKFELIPAQAYWIVIAALVTGIGVQQYRVSSLKGDVKTAGADLDKERAARTAERNARVQAALDHSDAMRKLQKHHAEAQKTKDDDYAEKLAQAETDRRAGAATADRLRSQLAAYTASGRRPGESDAAAAGRCADRLQAVGGLLGAGLGLVEEGRAIIARRDAEVARLAGQVQIDRAACSPVASK